MDPEVKTGQDGHKYMNVPTADGFDWWVKVPEETENDSIRRGQEQYVSPATGS
jgi:hypothetical protein